MNKILIVDASDSDRRLMSGLLTRAGYEPIVAEDMEAARQEVTKLSPGAVIVSAMKFRGGTAKELINWLKEEGFKSLIPRKSADFRGIEQSIEKIGATNANVIIFGEILEKIPDIIARYEERTAKLKADVPQLEAIISKTWGKEDELKQLKSELAALDRKITAELAPKHDENDGTENKQEQSQQPQTGVKSKTTANTVVVQPTNTEQGHKPSMVAEPQPRYPLPVSPPRFPSRHAGIGHSPIDRSGFIAWSVYYLFEKYALSLRATRLGAGQQHGKLVYVVILHRD